MAVTWVTLHNVFLSFVSCYLFCAFLNDRFLHTGTKLELEQKYKDFFRQFQNVYEFFSLTLFLLFIWMTNLLCVNDSCVLLCLFCGCVFCL